MANGHEINEEAEFKIHLADMQAKGISIEFFTAEKVFYLTRKVDKIDQRLVNVERNCMQAMHAIPTETPDCPSATQRKRHIAIGAGASGGGLLIIYGAVKLIAAHFGITI